MGQSRGIPAASWSLVHSGPVRKAARRICEASTRPSLLSRRRTSCSLDISREKKATGTGAVVFPAPDGLQGGDLGIHQGAQGRKARTHLGFGHLKNLVLGLVQEVGNILH